MMEYKLDKVERDYIEFRKGIRTEMREEYDERMKNSELKNESSRVCK
jgi:hypothetical protein